MFTKQLLTCLLLTFGVVHAQEPLYDQVFFSNSRMTGRYFYSSTSYQGPSWVHNIQGKLPVNSKRFFTPGNSLQLQFTNGISGSWSALIIRPEWRGQDFIRQGNSLQFKILVATPHTTAEQLPAVQIGKADSIFSTPISLRNYVKNRIDGKWFTVSIPLKDFQSFEFKKLTDINLVKISQDSKDGKEHLLFLDELEISPETIPSPIAATPSISKVKAYARHIDLEWAEPKDPKLKYVQIHRSFDGKSFKPIAIQSRYVPRFADFIGETGKSVHYKISYLGYDYSESGLSAAVSSRTRSMSDEELLTMIQEACFRYYYEAAEKQSGLAKENIPGRHNMIATGASGFGLMALITGTERKFITREQAVERFLKIVTFLEQADRFHGAYSHFVDGRTKKVEPFFGMDDNGGDLVETSFLVQGLLAALSYFDKDDVKEKQIREKIKGIWETVEWDWYRREPDSRYLFWHWSPDKEWKINHRLIGWNETMVTYLLAISSPTHSVPARMYYTGWASLDSFAQQYRKGWGQVEDGSKYVNANHYFGIPLAVGVSNGGPLFFTHYSYLGYDPHEINDAYTNYFANNRNIALINHRYCLQNPGKYVGYSDSCWGLTAGDGPFRYSASEPVLRMDDGKIVPTGAIASFPYTPELSMKALKNYYNNYGHFLWGEYGFRDAFNLTENWCSEIYMGLNQAPMAVMIENYRTGLIWKLFMKQPDIQNGLKKFLAEKPLNSP